MSDGPFTLAIDIGGTGLKASVLDRNGEMVAPRQRVETPHPSPPIVVVEALVKLVAPLPAYERISIGFPGVVRDGRVITAPHLGTDDWRDFPLQDAMAQKLGRSCRMLNDAEVQGLGIATGFGLEVVLTLGTGIGSAVFSHGRPTPHLELAHHPIHDDKTYDDYLGDAERKKVGNRKWNKRLRKAIDIVHTLLNYDTLYLGGGNVHHLEGDLPVNVHVESNDKGLTGGIRLWDDKIWGAMR